MLNALVDIVIKKEDFGLHRLHSGGTTLAVNKCLKDTLFKKHEGWKSENAEDGYIENNLELLWTTSSNLVPSVKMRVFSFEYREIVNHFVLLIVVRTRWMFERESDMFMGDYLNLFFKINWRLYLISYLFTTQMFFRTRQRKFAEVIPAFFFAKSKLPWLLRRAIHEVHQRF